MFGKVGARAIERWPLQMPTQLSYFHNFEDVLQFESRMSSGFRKTIKNYEGVP